MNEWIELVTGHWQYVNTLGISVTISPRDEPLEDWRYRVANVKYVSAASYDLASVKTLALHRLSYELMRLYCTLNEGTK